MSFQNYSLGYSLRGLYSLQANAWDPVAFPLSIFDWNRYVNNEQAFYLSVRGLKPNTIHRVYINDVDVTAYCRQKGYNIGDGIRTTPYWSAGNVAGEIDFIFYYKASLDVSTPLQQAASHAELFSTTKHLVIRSIDGISEAVVAFRPPQYGHEEPNVIVKKTPGTSPGSASTVSYTETEKVVLPGPYFTPQNFTMIQTFYADPEVVKSATAIALTSIDLYFKLKPSKTNNLSGSTNLGVSVAICEVENDQPILAKTFSKSLCYAEYSKIYAFADASTATTFKFDNPIRIPTGKFYGIVVMAEDPGFNLWLNKTGDKLVGTNTPSPGVNLNKDGKLFMKNNASVYNSLTDTDLKFNIKCAKYLSTTNTKTLVNKDYEFLTVTRVGSTKFLGGEWIYSNVTASNGTCSVVQGSNTIIGLGTSFSGLRVGQPCVFKHGSNSQIVNITNIVNNTVMTVSQVIQFSNTAAKYLGNTVIARVVKQDHINNKLHLIDSTANVVYFDSNTVIIGCDSNAQANVVSVDDYEFDRIRLRGDIRTPTNSRLFTYFYPTSGAPGAYTFDNTSFHHRPGLNKWLHYNLNRSRNFCLSRSNEIHNTLYSNTTLNISNKSIQCKIDAEIDGVVSDGIFQAPEIDGGKLDVYAVRNVVSNACNITTNNVILDSEVFGNGIALSKHLSNKVTFNNNRTAEDVRMFMTAYRPLGTEIRCYARLYNSKDNEAFDDKAWTPLEYVSNINNYSSRDDEHDFIEYELGLPQYSEAANTLPGTFTTSYNSTSISVANTTVCFANSYLVADDVIRVYNPLFPNDNYEVGVVASANITHIILSSAISTNNVAGTGYKIDKVKYPQMMFNNINNSNIGRYFNSQRTEFDGYNSMQFKIVMLADTTYKVPRVDQIQSIGVSA